MTKKSIVSIFSVLLFMSVAFVSCKIGSSGNVTVGSSCDGIGSSEARFACEGSKALFCSSFTGYKYKLQTQCPEGQVCELMAGGKGSKCVPKK